MAETVDVAVVGGGQAGLASSYYLSQAGIDHVVLERARIGQSWRHRWDSFCLVLPNWTLRLPGFAYDGDDPDGFLPRDGIVQHLEDYARSIAAPIREGVDVQRLEPAPSGWTLHTDDGAIRAAAVIVATGSFADQVRPAGWETIPPSVQQVGSGGYRNPGSLAPGAVLVVGSGQSGCQIADDLHAAGRDVFLACGRAPWLPRRAAGHDIFWWIHESGFMEMPLANLPDPRERLGANPQLTGRDGGKDLHYRTLAGDVTMLGRFAGSDGEKLFFGGDLAESVAFGDDVYRRLGELIRGVASDKQIELGDELADPPPWDTEGVDSLSGSDLGAVVWASGFRPGYRRWIDDPAAFDPLGFPIQDADGVGPLPGLHFVGAHFQRKRKSALFMGVGEDSEVVVGAIERRLAS